MTRSGSSSSARDDMQDGFLCVEMENLECQILEGPESQGSSNTVNGLTDSLGERGYVIMGAKERRKEASALRCLTVKDIFGTVNDAIE